MGVELVAKRLEQIKQAGLYRQIRTVDQAAPEILVDGRKAALFCSNNYLGLADHPALKQASAEAVLMAGSSTAASRLVSGTFSLHHQLEQAIADWKRSESVLLFNSGYAANTGVISALAGRGDVVFSDRLNHASIIDGILLSGAKLIRYPHNDLDTLAQQLENHAHGAGLKLIVTDGVFSMDGDIAHLPRLAVLAEQYNALLMVDDAHAGGVLGEQGRGTGELLGVADKVTLQVGTLGKAMGSFGAYVTCSNMIREYLINRSRSFVFSTSLPPAVLAASLAAVKLIQTTEADLLRNKVSEHGVQFRRLLQQQGFLVPDGITPIIPLVVGSAEITTQFSARLLDEGIFVQGIRPPTVPRGTSRLRCTVMATHTEQQIESAVSSIVKIGKELGVI